MKPHDFIRLCLRCGDKVILTLTNGKSVTCFFRGYKTWEGTGSDLGYILFPVFYAVGKKGQMVRRSPFGSGGRVHFSFDDIKDVERVVVTYRHLGYYNNYKDCFNLGIRGPQAALNACRRGDGAFVSTDDDEPSLDVNDEDTVLLENGQYVVRMDFDPFALTPDDAKDEDFHCFIDIYERIENPK